MTNSVRLATGTLLRSRTTVGPRHDPYSRTTLRFVGYDGAERWKLILCGLAGCVFERDGVVTRAPEGGKEFNALVEQQTGQPVAFWDEGIWETKERALLARVGRARYDQLKAMEEADDRLLRYAM